MCVLPIVCFVYICAVYLQYKRVGGMCTTSPPSYCLSPLATYLLLSAPTFQHPPFSTCLLPLSFSSPPAPLNQSLRLCQTSLCLQDCRGVWLPFSLMLTSSTPPASISTPPHPPPFSSPSFRHSCHHHLADAAVVVDATRARCLPWQHSPPLLCWH